MENKECEGVILYLGEQIKLLQLDVDRVEYSKGDNNIENIRRTRDEQNPIQQTKQDIQTKDVNGNNIDVSYRKLKKNNTITNTNSGGSYDES